MADMELSVYLKKNSISQREMARRLGVSYGYINQICRKKRACGRKLALSVHRFCDGNVPLEILIDHTKSADEVS